MNSPEEPEAGLAGGPLKPILEFVRVNDQNTMTRALPDGHVVAEVAGSWSPGPVKITLGDLRKIAYNWQAGPDQPEAGLTRKPTEWEVLHPFDSFPEDILEAARKIGNYAKMQGWGHEWVLGDVSSAYKPASGLVLTDKEKGALAYVLEDNLQQQKPPEAAVQHMSPMAQQAMEGHTRTIKAILAKLQP